MDKDPLGYLIIWILIDKPTNTHLILDKLPKGNAKLIYTPG